MYLMDFFADLSACPKSSWYKKPDLSGLPVVCSISSKCTEVKCCMEVKPISRNFEAYINIDPCYKTMEIGIEEYKTKINLLTYSFGKMIISYMYMMTFISKSVMLIILKN